LAVVEDRTDLKEKILHVLKNHEEARASVEKGKRLVIEKLDWKHVAAQMLEIYEGCLQ
jgi:glycosyltransferase involved in cell wall biosynthesis